MSLSIAHILNQIPIPLDQDFKWSEKASYQFSEMLQSHTYIYTYIYIYVYIYGPMRRIVNQRWNLLYEDERLKKVFKNRPIIAYRKPKNLKDLLVRSKFVYEQEEEKGCSPYNDQRCSWCSQLKETSTFKSETTGKTFSILHKVNCKSSKIVYLVRCKCCHKQYVGRTWRQLRS